MSAQSFPSQHDRFALACFFTATFGWSWLFWRLSGSSGSADSSYLPAVLGVVAGFGPTLAAFGVTRWRSGWAGVLALLKRGVQWRVNWRWYAIVGGLPALMLLIALGVHGILGGTVPKSPATGRWGLAIVNFFLVMLIGGPLGEEFGWRGYALPTLQRWFSAFWSSVILGIVWACWHLPLFFMPNTIQHRLPFGLFWVNVVALSILFTWVYNNTSGSVLISILLHTAVNGWSWVIPVLPGAMNDVRAYAIATLLLTVTSAIVVFAFGARTLTGRSMRNP